MSELIRDFEFDEEGNRFYVEYEVTKNYIKRDHVTEEQFNAKKEELEQKIQEIKDRIDELFDEEAAVQKQLELFTPSEEPIEEDVIEEEIVEEVAEVTHVEE